MPVASALSSNPFVATITSADPAVRDRSIGALVESLSTAEILETAEGLEAFRTESRETCMSGSARRSSCTLCIATESRTHPTFQAAGRSRSTALTT